MRCVGCKQPPSECQCSGRHRWRKFLTRDRRNELVWRRECQDCGVWREKSLFGDRTTTQGWKGIPFDFCIAPRRLLVPCLDPVGRGDEVTA